MQIKIEYAYFEARLNSRGFVNKLCYLLDSHKIKIHIHTSKTVINSLV